MTRPGEIEITFRLSGQYAADLARMAKAAGKNRNSLSAFVRSILIEVLADDRAAHGPSVTRETISQVPDQENWLVP